MTTAIEPTPTLRVPPTYADLTAALAEAVKEISGGSRGCEPYFNTADLERYERLQGILATAEAWQKPGRLVIRTVTDPDLMDPFRCDMDDNPIGYVLDLATETAATKRAMTFSEAKQYVQGTPKLDMYDAKFFAEGFKPVTLYLTDVVIGREREAGL